MLTSAYIAYGPTCKITDTELVHRMMCLFTPQLSPVPNDMYTLWRHGYDKRCYFNVRSKADTSQLSLPQGTNNQKVENRKN